MKRRLYFLAQFQQNLHNENEKYCNTKETGKYLSDNDTKF